MNYLTKTKPEADAVQEAVFAKYKAKIAALDPDAIAPDGTIIGRNAATGDLEPNAARTTAWAAPVPMVQGHAIPVPQDDELALDDHQPTTTANPWPAAPPPGADDTDPLAGLPEWVMPTGAHTAYIQGAWVQHEGAAYECITPGLTVAPEPSSTVWRISPTPLFTEWKQPTDYTNAYKQGAVVRHEGKFYRSTYAGNDQIPGSDARYWTEESEPKPVATDWVEPVPGDGSTLYEINDEVIYQASRWRSKKALNASTPGQGPGWEEVPPT